LNSQKRKNPNPYELSLLNNFFSVKTDRS